MIPEIRFKGAYNDKGEWVDFTDPWEQRKLSDIYASIGNAFVGTATPYYVENGHFYLESNNIKDGQINHNTEIFINDEFYERQKDKWLHTGDMVMVQSGHVGHAAVIPEELDNSAAHALIMFRHPKEKIEPYFLNYQYQTNKCKKKIEEITTGNTIKHILASDMQEFVVDMPDYDEQKKIGDYFCNLDNLITLSERKLEAYKKAKKSMMQKLFSQQVRFKKDDGSEYEDWGKNFFVELFSDYSKYNKEEYKQYTAGKYGLKIMNIEKIKHNTSKHKIFEPNTLVLGIGIEELGISINEYGCVSPIYTTYKINNDMLDTLFVNYYIKGVLNKYKGLITHKSTRREYEFETKELDKLSILIPTNKEEQTKIANCLSKFDNLIKTTENQLEEYKKLKKCMLQKMFV